MGRSSVAGIVLAGGRSSRFGSDKLRAVYRGRPLLEHAVDRLGEVCDEIVVVVAPGGAAPPDVDARIVRDALEAEGPLAGAATGLGAVTAARSVVVGGDMPELAPAVVTAMLGVAEADAVDAVVLGDGARFRPLPCVLRTAPARRTARELLAAGERSLRALMHALGPAVLDEAVWTALDPARGTLFDVDVPADLDR